MRVSARSHRREPDRPLHAVAARPPSLELPDFSPASAPSQFRFTPRASTISGGPQGRGRALQREAQLVQDPADRDHLA